ncbi:MAG: acyl transferase [Bacteroidia bacterium]
MVKDYISNIKNEIFSVDFDFEKVALEIFRFQAKGSAVYKNYIDALKINPEKVNSINKIPFLPIQFFKSHKIITASQPETIFISSGTTGSERSNHYVADTKFYEQSFLKCFELFYGNIEEYSLLALMPGPPGHPSSDGIGVAITQSSLVFMTSELIRRTKNPLSGFYLNEFERLFDVIEHFQKQKQKFILFGLTYALLDFAQWLNSPLRGARGHIIETGGMKGRRREAVREEVHKTLCEAFGVPEIHSEYGMTELLSQAYSKGKGIFKCPPWAKIFIRDVNDPAQLMENKKTGGINIIDLANIYSCSFIATQDLGKKYDDGSFEVLGRFDDSDLRGCNLMVE